MAQPAPEQPEFVGVVTSRKSEIIPAPFTGRVNRLDVTPGQRVRAGDRIALLDDTDLKSKIAGLVAQEKAAKAEAGAAGAMAAAARTRLRATQKLVGMGAAPRIEAATVGAEVSSNGAQAGAAAQRGGVARAEREVLERQLSKAQVAAPTEGIVMQVKSKDGAVVNQGEPLARVYDPSDLLIRFAVPKSQRNLVTRGARVQLSIDGVDRPLWATVESLADEEAPINFTVVVADLDDSKLGPDEVRIATVARVKLASKSKPKAKS